MAKLRTEWTNKAKAQLKQICDYLRYEKKTPQGAANVKADLISASKGVTDATGSGKHFAPTSYITSFNAANNMFTWLASELSPIRPIRHIFPA